MFTYISTSDARCRDSTARRQVKMTREQQAARSATALCSSTTRVRCPMCACVPQALRASLSQSLGAVGRPPAPRWEALRRFRRPRVARKCAFARRNRRPPCLMGFTVSK